MNFGLDTFAREIALKRIAPRSCPEDERHPPFRRDPDRRCGLIVGYGSRAVKLSVSMWCPSDTRKPTLSEVGPGLQLRHCVLPQLDACPCASGTGARLQICSLIIIFPRGSVRSADASALLSGRHLGVAREMLNSPRASAAPRPRWRRSGWTVAALQRYKRGQGRLPLQSSASP